MAPSCWLLSAHGGDRRAWAAEGRPKTGGAKRRRRFPSAQMAVLGGIAGGLGGAGAWGTADFFAKRVVDRMGVPWTVLLGLGIGALPLLVAALWEGITLSADTTAWAALFGAAVGNVVGGFFLYDAFARGRLSVVSPVSSCYPAITVGLAAVVLGHDVALLTAAGIAAILAGITAVSQESRTRNPGDTRWSSGVLSALLAMLSFGFAFFWLVPATDTFGPFFAVAGLRLLGLPLAAAALLIVPGGRTVPHQIPWRLLLTVGLLDATAFLSFTSGISTSSVEIVAPLSALYPAVTVVLAMHQLGERFNRLQTAGLFLILLGVVLVSAS